MVVFCLIEVFKYGASHSLQVLSQFRALCKNNTNLEDAYVMGNRLVEFLGSALPNHPEYMNRTVLSLKNKSQQDLLWITQKMEELALGIDEQVLNDYFMHEYEPEPVDDDSVVSTEDESDDQESFTEKKREEVWAFDPFDLSDDEKPDITFSTTDTSTETTREFEVFQDPEPELSFSDEELSSSFLRKIANEEVTFETDSEAMDSWAQDDCLSQLSRVSSGTTHTNDPARIALRELISNAPRIHEKAMRNERARRNQSVRNSSNPPPPPPPRAIRTDWANFAPIRQQGRQSLTSQT